MKLCLLLYSLCDQQAIESPVWMHSQSSDAVISILGGGVERLKEDLEGAKNLFPEYEFITAESGPLHTEQY